MCTPQLQEHRPRIIAALNEIVCSTPDAGTWSPRISLRTTARQHGAHMHASLEQRSIMRRSNSALFLHAVMPPGWSERRRHGGRKPDRRKGPRYRRSASLPALSSSPRRDQDWKLFLKQLYRGNWPLPKMTRDGDPQTVHFIQKNRLDGTCLPVGEHNALSDQLHLSFMILSKNCRCVLLG